MLRRIVAAVICLLRMAMSLSASCLRFFHPSVRRSKVPSRPADVPIASAMAPNVPVASAKERVPLWSLDAAVLHREWRADLRQESEDRGHEAEGGFETLDPGRRVDRAGLRVFPGGPALADQSVVETAAIVRRRELRIEGIERGGRGVDFPLPDLGCHLSQIHLLGQPQTVEGLRVLLLQCRQQRGSEPAEGGGKGLGALYKDAEAVGRKVAAGPAQHVVEAES